MAYAIGTAHPVSLAVDTFGTEHVDPDRLVDLVWDAFDFRPAAIIRSMDLRRPIYEDTAAYGHFGRKEFPWEATDRADELRRAFGSATPGPSRAHRGAPTQVLSGPVSVCIDRPLLALDRPFTYDLPEELGAGIGSVVQVPFHGRATRGWVLGATEDVPGRGCSGVRKVVSAVRSFDERSLALYRAMSERYVAPLATVIGRAVPPRVASEELAHRAPRPGRAIGRRRVRHPSPAIGRGRACSTRCVRGRARSSFGRRRRTRRASP